MNSAGTFNFNGQNVSTLGNFAIVNGTPTTISGLAGRTITVGGQTILSGSPGNLLNLNPVSPWTLISADTVFAQYVTVANSNKSGGIQGLTGTGVVNGGNNTNWYFAPTVAAPTTVQYATRTLLLTINVPMARDSLSYLGSVVDSFTVSPPLPAGISLSKTTGVLSGTPTAILKATTFTIFARNSAGYAQTTVDITVSAAKPVVAFAASAASGTAPLTVSFADSSSKDVTKWIWYFGDGTADTVRNPTHLYATAGVFSVKLLVTSPGGTDSLTKTGYITVQVGGTKPVAAFSASPTSGMVPLAVAFADSSSKDVSKRIWYFGDGGTDSIQNPMHTYSMPGTYTVKLVVRSSEGSDSLIKTGYIYVQTAAGNVPPVFSKLNSKTIPEDANWQDTIRATDADGDTIRYLLTLAPSGLSNGIFMWKPDDKDIGVNKIKISASDNRGATTTDSFTVTVTNVPEPPTIALSGDSTVTQYGKFRAFIQKADPDPSDSVSYVSTRLPFWMTRSGDTLMGTPTLESSNGLDSIAITVSDKSGTIVSISRKISVLNANDAPVALTATIPDSTFMNTSVSGIMTFYDQDKNDSLSCKSVTPSSMKVTVTKDSATGWRVAISGVPGTGTSGWNSITLRMADRAGAEYTLTDSVFVIYVPSTVLLSKKQWYGAASYSVRVRTTDQSHIRFTYARSLTGLDNTKKIGSVSSADSVFVFSPLVNGRYLFTCAATDQYGVVDPIGIRDTITISGASSCTFADTTDWHLMAVPALSLNADSIGNGGSVAHWDESKAERSVYSYYQMSSDFKVIAAGNAYWRKSSRAAAVVLSDAHFVTSAPFAMRLTKSAYGWNQIASPFAYAVQWPDKSVLWKWNPQTRDFEQAGGVLEPWSGYWVLTDSSRTVTLNASPIFRDGKLAKTAKVAFVNKSNWQMNISLNGAGRDSDNRIGFSDAAADGYDRMDIAEPPRMGGSSYLYMPHPDWKSSVKEYSSDIRHTFQPVNIFQIAIAATDNSVLVKTAAISLDGISKLSGMYVYMESGDSVIAIGRDTVVSVETGNTPVYKTLFISTNKDFGQTFPTRFAFGAPYPNPCVTRANIRYTLPYRRDAQGMIMQNGYIVKLQIYDAAGRVVCDLLDRQQNAGNYTVLWNGTSNSGRRVVPGVYFCSLTAGSYSAVNKMMVVR